MAFKDAYLTYLRTQLNSLVDTDYTVTISDEYNYNNKQTSKEINVVYKSINIVKTYTGFDTNMETFQLYIYSEKNATSVTKTLINSILNDLSKTSISITVDTDTYYTRQEYNIADNSQNDISDGAAGYRSLFVISGTLNYGTDNVYYTSITLDTQAITAINLTTNYGTTGDDEKYYSDSFYGVKTTIQSSGTSYNFTMFRTSNTLNTKIYNVINGVLIDSTTFALVLTDSTSTTITRSCTIASCSLIENTDSRIQSFNITFKVSR